MTRHPWTMPRGLVLLESGREVYNTGRVFIGARVEPEPRDMTDDEQTLQALLIDDEQPLRVEDLAIVLIVVVVAVLAAIGQLN